MKENEKEEPLQQPRASDASTSSLLRTMLTPDHPPRRFTPEITLEFAAKAVLLYLAVRFVFAVWQVLLLAVFSLMVATALNPVVNKMERRIGRGWSVLIIVAVLVACIVGVSILLGPMVYEQTLGLLKDAPRMTSRLQQILRAHHIHVNLQDPLSGLADKLSSAVPRVIAAFAAIGTAIAAFVVVIVMAIYMLLEAPRLSEAVLYLLPATHRSAALRLADEVSDQVGGYIRGQVVASILAGVFSAIALTLIHVPNALVLAALAAALDVLPFVGVLISGTAAGVMALTVSPTTLGIVLVVYLIYHQLESHVIIPQIYGNTLKLPLTVIVLSVLMGAELIGIPGIILGLPTAAAIPSLVRFLYDWHRKRDVRVSGGTAPGGNVGSSENEMSEEIAEPAAIKASYVTGVPTGGARGANAPGS